MIIERELYAKIKPVINRPEAIIITGMRRVGKTTLLGYIFERIKSDNKIFLDLENPVNRKYFEEENYEVILDNLQLLGLNLKKISYIFLDEIQFAKNIPSVVKYFIDHYKIKFFLSGSASFYLKNLFSESLSGRKYIFELFPLNFREFLSLRNEKVKLPSSRAGLSSAVYEHLNRYYNQYIIFGGFPGVVKKKTVKEKKMMLEDIFSSYFQSEVTQLGDFRKTGVIRDLLLILMRRTGSKLDILKLSRELGISRITLTEYISFLESTYFITLIRPFSRNRDTELRAIPKFYLCDSGLVNHFSKIDKGCLFENSVFCQLRTQGEINYYQKKSGLEIDFILNKRQAVEVKNAPSEQDLNRLRRVSQELKLKDYKIISGRYSSLHHITYGFML